MTKNITISLFEFSDYQAYLSALIASLPKHGHGFRIKIAECMRCEPGYVSHILKGRGHFSVEQAEALSGLLNHTPDEFTYFILMVELARAGTKRLKEHKLKQMNAIVQKRLELKSKIPAELPFGLESQTTYFSHWHYTAVHVLVSIPEFRTKESLLSRLRISAKRLGEVLDFLLQTGLIISDATGYRVGNTRVHLPRESPLVARNHAIWRYQAMNAIDENSDRDFHYTGVMTMSEKDALKVREIYFRAIEEMNSIVKDSKDETALAIALDFFHI
jgi:uncharacterized protein (TIGR02147 family)